MDKAYIDKHHVIEHFVTGKLKEPMLSEFEKYLLDHPGILEDIQHAEGLQQGLQRSETGALPTSHESGLSVSTSTQPPWLKAYAIAATVLLMGAGALLMQSGPLSPHAVSAGASGVEQVALFEEYVLEATRSSDARVIKLRSSVPALLRIDAGPTGDEFDLALSIKDAKEVWSRRSAKASASRELLLKVNGLQAGEYELNVTGADSSGIKSQTSFRILVLE